MFWDSSALLPFLVPEELSREITALLQDDDRVVTWWATRVECLSAIERKRREGDLSSKRYVEARRRLEEVSRTSHTVEPHPQVRLRAEKLLGQHALRAGDSLQLAAALAFCDDRPQDERFVSLDSRLKEAAEKEGFVVLP